MSRITHYILCVVEIWLLIFNIILKRLIHIIVCSSSSIFLWLLWSISVCEYSAIYIPVFFLMSIWIVFSLQLYHQCYHKYSCTSLSSHTNAFLLYIYLEVELLSLELWVNVATMPHQEPTMHSLLFFFTVASLTGRTLHLRVVLWVFKITNKSKHFFQIFVG